MARLFGGIYGKSVVSLFGFVLSGRAPLQMYFFGTAKGPHWAKGHFKDNEVGANRVLLIVLCLWEGGVFLQFSWPKRWFSLAAILEGGKSQDVPGVLAAKVVRSASTPPLFTEGSGRPCNLPLNSTVPWILAETQSSISHLSSTREAEVSAQCCLKLSSASRWWCPGLRRFFRADVVPRDNPKWLSTTSLRHVFGLEVFIRIPSSWELVLGPGGLQRGKAPKAPNDILGGCCD